MNKSNKNFKSNGNRYKNKKGDQTNRTPSHGAVRGEPQNECLEHQHNLNCVTSNDPKYYNKIPSLYVPATQVPWAQIHGDISDWWITKDNTGAPFETVENDYALPGIMSIDFVPTVGWASDVQSPLNRATNILMTNLYSKLGASTIPFAEADLTMFLASMGSIACTIAYLARAIRSTEMFLPLNINYPRAILAAMGFSYEHVVENTPEYLVKLNALIRAFNNFRIPNFIDVYVRQFALANNIYLDEDSQVSNVYIFNPVGIYRYSDTESKCTFDAFVLDGPGDKRMQFDLVLDKLTEALDAWRNSQDLYYINGILQRAYKDSDFLFIPEVMETDLQAPVIDRNISMQITNMTITPVNYGDLAITQDPVQNIVICKPTAKISKQCVSDSITTFGQDNWMLRSFDVSTSADDNMEMTRLVNFLGHYNGSDENYIYCNLENCGPEIVTKVGIWRYDRDEDYSLITELFSNIIPFNNRNVASIPVDYTTEKMALVVGMLSQFKYHPSILLAIGNTFEDVTDSGTIVPLGDIYRYTPLSRDKWELLQTAAKYSLFSVKLPEGTIII